MKIALALGMGKLEQMVVGDATEIAAEEFARVDLVEAVRIVPRPIGFALAAIHRRAVGRDRHDDVVGAIVEMPRQLDRRDNIGEAGNADIVEHPHQLRIDLLALGKVFTADIVVE